jgi:arginine N-succinyltransferase
VLRDVQERDIESLERLATIPGFINLQNDRDFLKEKISRAQESFHDRIADKWDAKYVFVAEDSDTGRVLGTSMIAAQHGTVEAPHFYFEVGSEEKFSATINTGFIHGTLKLKYDTNGPSEIGGLVMDAEARNRDDRVGRQISFVRFLYLGLNRARFKRKVLAELLPPLNKKGQSPLWEAVGRRFTNMDYWEADQLSQKNKEFLFSLFPSGKIYTTFLPAEARNAIGKVGKDTEPVVHMLNKIGFAYRNQVDPFDGGPHLWANTDDILPVRKLGTYAFSADAAEGGESGLLTRATQKPGGFRAVSARAVTRDGKLQLAKAEAAHARRALGLEPGESVAFMPYY